MASKRINKGVDKNQRKIDLMSILNSTDFSIVSQSPLYIDKTLLIKEIFNDRFYFLLITVPHGFGKSTNLDMVRRFATININKQTGKIRSEQDSMNYNLFQTERLISFEHDIINKYCGKFGTIHISFKDVYADDIDSLMIKYAKTLSKVFIAHKYLSSSEKLTSEEKEVFNKYLSKETYRKLPIKDLESGINFLAKMISKHCDDCKIFIFIDDYDTPLFKLINDKSITEEDEDQFSAFFANIFGNIFSENGYINRALITGLSSLGTTLFPTNCPVKICRFMSDHSFADYYGITSEEFNTYSSTFAFNNNEKKNIIRDCGYETLQKKTIICTRSILHLLNDEPLDTVYNYMEDLKKMSIKFGLNCAWIRYIIEKTSVTDAWHPVVVYSFLSQPKIINTLSKICTGFSMHIRQESLSEYNLYYILLLIELGYFRIKKRTHGNVTLINVANVFVQSIFLNEMKKFDLNKRFISTAEHLNALTASSDQKYFEELSKLLQPIYSDYKLKMMDENDCFDINIFNESLAEPFYDVLAKSRYFISFDVGGPGGVTFDFKSTWILCVFRFQSNAKQALQVALDNKAFVKCLGYDNKIFIGINFDENMSASFAVLINNLNILNAMYYNI